MRMVSLSAAALKKKRCIRRCSMKARGASKVKACSSIFNRVLRYDLTPLRENIVYFSSISKLFQQLRRKEEKGLPAPPSTREREGARNARSDGTDKTTSPHYPPCSRAIFPSPATIICHITWFRSPVVFVGPPARSWRV